MNSKIIIAATIAGLSLATTAFAQGESSPATAAPGSVYSRLTFGGLDNTTLPENGSEGAVQSPNSLPPGFFDGTPQARYVQSTNRWFAQQAEHRFAEGPQTNTDR